MAYIKIFSKQELPEEYGLCFDYKCEGEDSSFCPEPTYEYLYELAEGWGDLPNSEEVYSEFINNVHFIYGWLNSLGVDWTYTVFCAEYMNKKNPFYIEGLAANTPVAGKWIKNK